MIFISHKKEDEALALTIMKRIERRAPVYIDVLDPNIGIALDITRHIINQLRKCSHIITVFTKNTLDSLWVPFELGAAYESNKGIGTYVADDINLPEYLDAFPIMRNESALDLYIEAYKMDRLNVKMMNESEKSAYLGADNFIRHLKVKLRKASKI